MADIAEIIPAVGVYTTTMVFVAEEILIEGLLIEDIFAADVTISEADITLAIMAAGPDGIMIIMATGFRAAGFGNGILIMEDG